MRWIALCNSGLPLGEEGFLKQMEGIRMIKNKHCFRTAGAADYCGSSKSTFEKLRLTGGGPVFIKLGRTVVYDVDDLDAWLAKNRRHSTSEAA